MCGITFEINCVNPEGGNNHFVKKKNNIIMDSIQNLCLAYVTVKGRDCLITCHAGTKEEQRYSSTSC